MSRRFELTLTCREDEKVVTAIDKIEGHSLIEVMSQLPLTVMMMDRAIREIDWVKDHEQRELPY